VGVLRVRADRPVVGVLIPDDGLEAEHAGSDAANSVVDLCKETVAWSIRCGFRETVQNSGRLTSP
jgi:hypothetical protein